MSDSLSFLRKKARQLPHKPGVYLMRNVLGKIIYVGKAKDLQKRVSSYFQASRQRGVLQPKIKNMISLIATFDIIEVKSEAEALILESKLIKEWKPKYNTDLKDDKGFVYIAVNPGLAIPKFKLTYSRAHNQYTYFGPFTQSRLARKTLQEMRLRFGILLDDATPRKMKGDTYLLYQDARSEIYGFDNEVTSSAYQERVRDACEFLKGKSKEWLKETKIAMQEAAHQKQYEKAAKLRDILFGLEQTLQPSRQFKQLVGKEHIRTLALKSLQEKLQLRQLPNHIECFDISHISGTFIVASMVCFKDGKPYKNQYRRYKIKSFTGNDDYRAMEEVVLRRYARLKAEDKPLPDILLIDGGKGQVHAALKAFLVADLVPPSLIGLAKKNETIVFPKDKPSLQLARNDPALQLLQQLRDEAHRFSNQFNADLRSKKIKESILDDFKGLGEKKKSSLFKTFKTISQMRKASCEKLQTIEGIGPKLARELYDFLRG